MVAFHGEPSLKSAVMDRLREHRRLDEITQGVYFEDGRGCHLGCITHANNNSHEEAERLFGIEQRIGYWLEAIFEGLPKDRCAAWVIESTEAIPCGADLSKCHHHLAAWLLGDSGLLTITDVNRAAIEQVHLLHMEAINGQPLNEAAWSAAESAGSARSAAESAAWSARSAAESAAWSARSAARSAAESARSAAWSAESAAWSARSAAESAAWSAGSAAESAAWSARSAARSAAESARSAWSARSAAWSAAWSAAESAAWSAAESARSAAFEKIAAKSIEIFRNAPVPSNQPAIETCVRSELCAKRLWCPDTSLVLV